MSPFTKATNYQAISTTSDPQPGSVKPGILESIAHWMQVLNLTHSWWNLFAWVLKPITHLITLYQSLKANAPEYLYRKRLTFGENFVCAGGVWMSGYEDVKRNLVEPQARTFKLAPSQLDKEHLPTKADGSLTFLLVLSQKGAGGDGKWEAYRSAFQDYVSETEEKKRRMNGDETTKKLFAKLEEDYKKSDKTTESPFFTDSETGVRDFLLRYLHYVLFGIDPFDETKMQALNHLHYDSSSAAYYLGILGNVLGRFVYKDWPERFERVATMYEESPALSNFEGGQDKYNNISRHELAQLCVSMMSLAGMVGPKTLCSIVLGVSPLPSFEGTSVGDIDVTKKWDELDLSNRDEVRRYVHECGRLRNPVSNTHKVATEETTVKIGNRYVKFGKGTIIYISMLLGGLDKNAETGGNMYEFDHNRVNVVDHSMIFHSFGSKTNGRICPGKAVAENMVIDMLIKLGQIRRKDAK